MNKKLALGLGIVGIAAAGIGSVAYIAKSNLEKREQILLSQISSLQGNLPSGFKLDKIESNSNLFESRGKYLLESIDAVDKNNNAKVMMDYEAAHGPKSWFGGEIQFIVNGKVEGELVKTYQISTNKAQGISFTVKGILTEDNTIVAKNSVNDFSFIVPVPVHENEVPTVDADNANKAAKEAVATPTASNNPEVVANPNEPIPNTPISAVAKISKEDLNKQVVKAAKDASVTDKKSATGMLVDVKGSGGIFTFNTNNGDFTSEVTYSSVIAKDLEEPKDKVIATNLGINYESNVQHVDIGTLKIKAGSFSNGEPKVKDKKPTPETETMRIDGFELLVATEQKNQKYNMKLNTKVQNLQVMEQKGSFEIGYSINGIDKAMIVLSKKIGKTYASRADLSEKEAKEAKEILMNNLKTGFAFNIDKLYLKNEKNLIDFSGNYEIVPTPKDKQFSFQTQSKFGSKFKVEGDLVPVAGSLFGSFLGVHIPEDAKTFEFKASFENGALKVNDKAVDPGINDTIVNALKTVDGNLGLVPVEVPAVTQEVKPEEKAEEKVEVKIEAKEESKADIKAEVKDEAPKNSGASIGNLTAKFNTP